MERPDKGPVHSSEKMGPATFTRKRKDRLSLTRILYNLFAPKVGPMNELPASYQTDPFPQQSASDLQKHRPGSSAWPQSSTNRKGRDPVFHRVYHSWTPRNQIRRNGASENASEKKSSSTCVMLWIQFYSFRTNSHKGHSEQKKAWFEKRPTENAY